MKSIPPIRLAWVTAFLCAACCAVVPLLVVLGLVSAASAVVLTMYFEFAAVVFLILSIAIFGYIAFRKKRPSSEQGCSCNDSPT